MTTYKSGKSALRALMLKTGQATTYHIGDDGNYQKGIALKYTVNTTGAQSGTSNIDVAHYAAATLSFTAVTKKIVDTANGLVTFLTGDTIVVKGSGANDGVYTVAVGGVAGEIVTTEALVNEGAGAYISLYKRTSISNNTVLDCNTGKTWLRNTTTALKIGEASTGLLNWYDATKCFTLHPAAGDLQIIAAPSNTLRIVGGAGEVNRYHSGDLLDLTGFATAVNNIPGYRVLSVTVNGADLDIVINPVRSVLVAEAAAGSRSILLICRSIFTYCASANAAVLGGYSDWEIPNDITLLNLRDMEAPTAVPDPVAFPTWTILSVHNSMTKPDNVANTLPVAFAAGNTLSNAKTVSANAVMVKGGF